MNVNSGENKKRVRRTPEEARALILRVAAERLAELGLEGLNIAGVARAAGMSHGTVIHHFGSTAAMREALLESMTQQLLTDVMQALDHHEPADRLLERLFGTLSRDGHGRLLAWLALDRESRGIPAGQQGGTSSLFANIIRTVAQEKDNESEARQVIYLVALAAMGLSISGDSLPRLLGMTESEVKNFPHWMAEHITDL